MEEQITSLRVWLPKNTFCSFHMCIFFNTKCIVEEVPWIIQESTQKCVNFSYFFRKIAYVSPFIRHILAWGLSYTRFQHASLSQMEITVIKECLYLTTKLPTMCSLAMYFRNTLSFLSSEVNFFWPHCDKTSFSIFTWSLSSVLFYNAFLSVCSSSPVTSSSITQKIRRNNTCHIFVPHCPYNSLITQEAPYDHTHAFDKLRITS